MFFAISIGKPKKFELEESLILLTKNRSLCQIVCASATLDHIFVNMSAMLCAIAPKSKSLILAKPKLFTKSFLLDTQCLTIN